MKIAIFLPDLRGGGAERVNLDLAHEFTKAGHIVEFVLVRAEGELLEEANAAFSVVDLASARFRQSFLRLIKYVRKKNPDILIAAMWPLTFLGPLAGRLAGKNCRTIVSEHGILSKQYEKKGSIGRFLFRLSMFIGYRAAHACVGVSHGVVADLAVLSRIPVGRFTTIYNPVRIVVERDDSALARAEALWGGAKTKRILSVGSLKRVKNHALLLRALAAMSDEKAKLMIVGDGPEKDYLAGLVQDLNLESRVIFTGFQPNPTPFYLSSDIFVLSSCAEGFGNVIVEAMAQGLPIVSTDCRSGPAEILEGGQYGRLVPVGDVNALAEAMERVLDEEPDVEALRSRARKFAPEIAAQKYLDVVSPP